MVWSGELPAKVLIRLWTLLTILFLLSAMPLEQARARAYLEPIGGTNGAQFDAPCAAGQNLVGFEFRHGLWIDAGRPVCATAFGPTRVSVDSSGQYAWQGGSGGTPRTVICPPETPLLLGMHVVASGFKDVSVTGVQLYCGLAQTGPQELASAPSETIDSPPPQCNDNAIIFRTGCDPAQIIDASQSCPPGQVAIGLNGRANSEALEAIGLICDVPRITNDHTGKALGRVASTGAGGSMSMCDRAKDARARNSPVAPMLERQCAAEAPVVQDAGPAAEPPRAALAMRMPVSVAPGARSLGRVQPIASSNVPGASDAASRTLLDQLEAAGQVYEQNMPLAGQLASVPEISSRRAYDIGLGLIGQSTAVPPNAKQVEAALPSDQHAFGVGTDFALTVSRNYNLVQGGAQVARISTAPGLAEARGADSDPRFTLGFDIASGLFAEPRYGGQGQRAMTISMSLFYSQLSSHMRAGFDAGRRFYGVGS